MQLIYGAPFVLLSLIAFAGFLVLPRLRRFALSALVASVAFGVCALIGYVVWVLVCRFVLKIQLRPVEGVHGLFDVLFFFLAPGFFGSWAAVWTVEKIRQRLRA